MSHVALVTGANRGIGFEVCRQLAGRDMTVLLGARDPEKGEFAAKQLAREGFDVLPCQLDVVDEQTIEGVRRYVEDKFGRLDVLVNNAGISYDAWQKASGADLGVVHDAFETNLFGAWRTCETFLPLIRRSEHGRIVNVASEAGSFLAPQGLASMGGGLPAYAISKAALNAFTIKLAVELKDSGILVNSVCPGYTATYPEAEGGRPVEEGAASLVWAATLPNDGPTGGFFRDGKPLPW